MVEIYSTATEYISNELTFFRGSEDDINTVGVYHSTTPTDIPEVSDFKEALKVLSTDSLSQSGKTEVLSLIGPASSPGVHDTLAPGVYQRWILVQTNSENIIRRVDTLEVL